MSNFLESTTWTRTTDTSFNGAFDESWMQGRAAFGGVVVGGAVRSLTAALAHERPLRSLLVSFVGPVKPGEFSCEVELLRSGSSFSHTQARVIQDGTVRTVVFAGFGDGREGGVYAPTPERPDVQAPDALVPMRFVPGLSPNFTQKYDYRFVPSSLPFSGVAAPEMRCWLRERDNPQHDAASIAGLLDAPPPPIWPVLSMPAKGSTITWQVTILEPELDSAAGDGWYLFDAKSNGTAHGYCDFESVLWDPSGRAVALSRQVFADFSRERT